MPSRLPDHVIGAQQERPRNRDVESLRCFHVYSQLELAGPLDHDLKHTFGERLRAAGVQLELRQVLLAHRNENITTHYSTPRIRELREAAERVVEVKDSPSVVRLIGGVAVQGPPKVPQKKPKAA